MSRAGARARAIAALEEAGRRLGEIANSNARDPGFRQWRQATLTLVQRLWPGDADRAGRFRDIRFSVSGARPDPAAARDEFASGCAVATAFLRELVDEVTARGLPPGSGTSSAASGGLPRLTPPRLAAPAPRPEAAGGTPRRRPRDLREMLGLDDQGEPRAPGAAGTPPDPAPPGRGPESGGAVSAADFLARSAVFHTRAGPVRRLRRPASSRQLAGGPEVLALAVRLARLDVPAEAREGLRDALVELARQLDSPAPAWAAMRRAIHAAMEHPRVARELLRIVVPHLDRAA